MNQLIFLPIIVPIFSASICLLLWKHERAQKIVSVLGAVLLAASGGMLVYAVCRHDILVVQPGNWPAPFGISLVADRLSAAMVAVTGLIGLSVLIYSLFGVDQARQQFGFHSLFHTLLLGVCGAFLTADMFNLYVWFEVMLIASFVLLALGGEKAQLEGAIKYVTLNLISSALFLAAAGVLYGTVGTLSLADLAQALAGADTTVVPSIAGGILLIAFGIKAAAFPLFFWLPASYHTPPAAISAVMAGLLTKVGVYSLVRVFSLVFIYDFVYIQPILLVIAGLTMLTGVLGAAAQSEFRRILSFHIISQIGYMLLGLAIFTPLALAGTVFYLVHHIVVKTNLFLIAGIVNRIKQTNDLSKLGSIYRYHPWLALLFLVPALSLAGLPPLSGFWAKLMIVKAGLEAEHYFLVGTALVVSLLTLFSMTKIWNEAFWKSDGADYKPLSPDTGLRWMIAACVALAAVTVSIGFYAEPLVLFANSAAEQLLSPDEYIAAVMKGK